MNRMTQDTHQCVEVFCPECGQLITDTCYCFQLENAICSDCLEVANAKPEPIDNFQPMQVIRFLKDARTSVRQIPTAIYGLEMELDGQKVVWTEDMKKGALLALAWVHAEITIMAANRYKE